jgi:hypothetical protein
MPDPVGESWKLYLEVAANYGRMTGYCASRKFAAAQGSKVFFQKPQRSMGLWTLFESGEPNSL